MSYLGHSTHFRLPQRQKQGIRDELQSVNKQREALRTELRSIRDKTKINFDSMETKIEEIEFKLSHESLSVQDEQRLQQSLSQFTTARPLAKQIGGLQATLAELEEKRTGFTGRLQECDKILDGVTAKETVAKAELNELKTSEEGEMVDIPSLIVERKECYEIINAMRDAITEVRTEFDARYKHYITLDRNYNGFLYWERKTRCVTWSCVLKSRSLSFLGLLILSSPYTFPSWFLCVGMRSVPKSVRSARRRRRLKRLWQLGVRI
jgi:tRNA U55 pseudouridine synthase TruB